MHRSAFTSWVDVAFVGTGHNRRQIPGRSSEPCLAYLTRVNVEMLELAEGRSARGDAESGLR